MTYRDIIVEVFYIIILLRKYVVYLIRFSADDYLIITL